MSIFPYYELFPELQDLVKEKLDVIDMHGFAAVCMREAAWLSAMRSLLRPFVSDQEKRFITASALHRTCLRLLRGAGLLTSMIYRDEQLALEYDPRNLIGLVAFTTRRHPYRVSFNVNIHDTRSWILSSSMESGYYSQTAALEPAHFLSFIQWLDTRPPLETRNCPAGVLVCGFYLSRRTVPLTISLPLSSLQ